MEMVKSQQYIVRLTSTKWTEHVAYDHGAYRYDFGRAIWLDHWTFRSKDIRDKHPPGSIRMRRFSGCPGCGYKEYTTNGLWGQEDWSFTCVACGCAFHPEKWYGPVNWKWHG